MSKKTNEAMQACLKIVDGDWEVIAKVYGYKSGKSLKDTFRKWQKKQEEKETVKEAVVLPHISRLDHEPPPVDKLADELKKDAQKGITIDAALEKYRITYKCLENLIDIVRKGGLNIMRSGEQIYVGKFVVQGDNSYVKKWDGNQILRFGVIADTHIGSKFQQMSLLHKAYDLYQSRGITDIYHAGDISEGIKMRPGHEQECFLHGSDDIERYIIENYPRRDGMTTHFITGNHDHSIIKRCGHDIGPVIEKERDDMIYLGAQNALVYLTPNCTMELNHPLDGAAYALSYSIQKYADSMSGGEKPGILINGHHHKAMYLLYRNIHMLEAGCFQAQSLWMKGKELEPWLVAGT
jgi:UDP-2,3-diacylglucosamine pyrophosphatase LpxH